MFIRINDIIVSHKHFYEAFVYINAGGGMNV